MTGIVSQALVVGEPAQFVDRTSIQQLEWAAEQAPTHMAVKQPFEGFGEEIAWTYAEFLADARRLASYLAQFYKYGDHLAIWAPNSAPWLLYEFATAHLGVVLVALNPALVAAEIDYMLRRSRAKGIVMGSTYRGLDMPEALSKVRGGLPDLQHVHLIDEWRDQLARGTGDPPPSPTKPSDAGLIVFTSGTTGKPKAALLHHFGIVNNPRLAAARLGLRPHSNWLSSLPMFHVGGTVTLCMGAVSQLSTQIIMPPFQPDVVLGLIEKERIHYTALVPAMVIAMIEHPDFRTFDLSSLENIQVGGTAITPSFVKQVRQELGCDVQVVMGQTECCSEITKTLRGDPDAAIEETVGIPYPGTILKISNPATGDTMAVGEVGEIRLLSPCTALGYFDDPEATASLFDDEGFLRTGDLGLIDADGRLRMSGRLKEIIIRGGENIYPREIEDAIAEFEGVGESAVVGVPHPRWGEEVAVALRLSDPTVDIEAIREHLLTRLARHKVPKHWRIVNDFPRNASGKTQKFEVQRMFEENLDAG